MSYVNFLRVCLIILLTFVSACTKTISHTEGGRASKILKPSGTQSTTKTAGTNELLPEYEEWIGNQGVVLQLSNDGTSTIYYYVNDEIGYINPETGDIYAYEDGANYSNGVPLRRGNTFYNINGTVLTSGATWYFETSRIFISSNGTVYWPGGFILRDANGYFYTPYGELIEYWQDEPLPPRPTSVHVTENTDSTLALSWNSGGGSTVGFYASIQRGSTALSCLDGNSFDAGRDNTIRFDGLDEATVYTLSVCAYNSELGISESVYTVTQTTAIPRFPSMRIFVGGSEIPYDGSLELSQSVLGDFIFREIVVYNDGNADLVVNSSSFRFRGDPQFSMNLGISSTRIAPGETEYFYVELDTTRVGSFSSGLTFSSNDPRYGLFSMGFRGTVVASTADLDPLQRTDSIMLFYDNFHRDCDAELGENWDQVRGRFFTRDGHGRHFLDGASIAYARMYERQALPDKELKNLRILGFLSVDPTGNYMGLIARRAGNDSMYLVKLVGENGKPILQFQKIIAGKLVDKHEITVSSYHGYVTFDAFEDNMRIAFNNAVVMQFKDNGIMGKGLFGMIGYGKGSGMEEIDVFKLSATGQLESRYFRDNFDRKCTKPLGSRWDILKGNIETRDGLGRHLIDGTSMAEPKIATVADSSVSTTFIVDTNGINNIGAYFRRQSDGSMYTIRLVTILQNGTWKPHLLWEKFIKGVRTETHLSNPLASNAGALTATVIGTHIFAYWNGVLALDFNDTGLSAAGKCGVIAEGRGGAFYNTKISVPIQ